MIFDPFEFEHKLARLREREKELKCLYKVNEIAHENHSIDEFLMEIVKHIWGGWQFPVQVRVKILFCDKVYKEEGWEETEWKQSADIVIDDKVFGKIEVFYIQPKPWPGNHPFLPEEQKLLNAIAAQISAWIFNRKLLQTVETLGNENQGPELPERDPTGLLPDQPDIHWIWRNDMVLKIGEKLDPDRFGVEAMYLIGSAKNATSGPASDIDVLVHFRGDEQQRRELAAWFQGWSLCLAELNYMKTGYKSDGLIDLHIVTDQDIENKDSFASMIGAVTNGARLVRKSTTGTGERVNG